MDAIEPTSCSAYDEALRIRILLDEWAVQCSHDGNVLSLRQILKRIGDDLELPNDLLLKIMPWLPQAWKKAKKEAGTGVRLDWDPCIDCDNYALCKPNHKHEFGTDKICRICGHSYYELPMLQVCLLAPPMPSEPESEPKPLPFDIRHTEDALLRTNEPL